MAMLTVPQMIVLFTIGVIGHVMAAIWFVANRQKWSLTHTSIYAIEIKHPQLKREFFNSLHNPMHAVILAVFFIGGFFTNNSLASFWGSLVLTFVWAEVWHYFSHRAFHHPWLHWIHAEHHKSRINTPLTALSFSIYEKIIFDLGLISPLALIDPYIHLNAFGICAWYLGYLVINSYSHANFEMKSPTFLNRAGRFLTSTTYHSLHHSRYVQNYGLGTRFLDQLFGTEWNDYEPLYRQITRDHKPLSRLNELVSPASEPQAP